MAKVNGRAEVTVTLNGRQAEEVLDSLRQKSDAVREALVKAQKAGDFDSIKKLQKEANALDAAMRNVKKSTYDYSQVLRNLNGSSLRDLEKAQKMLRAEVRGLATDTQAYVEKSRQLQQVKQRLSELNRPLREQQSLLTRAAGGFNKYFGIVTAGVAAITGLSYTFRKLSEDVAHMDDVYSDVRKTTGLTVEEVKQLNEEFKKMDTRTGREELNNLARDAGKLGITGKENVLQFVKAANQINVALGEDLGEGAIRNIGKISDVFGQTKELGIEKAFLSIGSAINELGQSSTASEAYLVNFTQRLSGVGAQAGISVQNILGYASALDQSAQAVEMSATTMQKFIMKMYEDPAEFARIAGQDVKAFSELMKTDANAAIQTVLKALHEKGGFAQLVPIFKDMGMDGSRAVGVLSALASNLIALTTAQEVSNEAYAKASSLTSEYNIKNENLAAKLDKAKKNFKEKALILGESLNPALLQSTNLMTYLVKALVEIIKWMGVYGGTVLKVAAVIGAYVLAVKLQTLWESKLKTALTISNMAQKAKAAWLTISTAATHLASAATALFTGNLTRASASMKAFTATLKANPFALLASIAVAAGIALYEFAKKSKTAADQYAVSSKTISEATGKYVDEFVKEKQEANALIRTITDVNTGQSTRLRLINQLKDKYPDFLKYINAEKVSNDELLLVLNQINSSYDKKFKMAALQGKADAYTQKIVEMETRRLDITERMVQLNKTAITPGTKLADELKDLQAEDALLDIRIGGYEKKVNEFAGLAEGIKEEMNNALSIDGLKVQIEAAEKYIATSRKNANEAADAERKAFYESQAAQQLTQKTLLEKQLKEMVAAKKKITNNDDDGGDKPDDKELKKALKKELEQTEQAYKELQANIQQLRIDGFMEAEKANAELYAAETAFIISKIALYKKYGESTVELEKELVDRRVKLLEGLQKSAKEIEKDLLNSRLAWEKEYTKLTADSMKDLLREMEKAYRDMDKLVQDGVDDGIKSHMDKFKEWQQFRSEYNMIGLGEQYDAELAAFNEMAEELNLSTEEQEKGRFKIKMKYAARAAEVAGQFAQMAANVVSAWQDYETSKLNAEYDKRLAAAGDNAEAKEAIELEKAQKELELKKKFADFQFAVDIAQIGASTALGIMQAYAQLGPVGGTIAAVLVGAAGLLQTMAAKKQRDSVKAMTLDSTGGGATSQRVVLPGKEDGGYTDVERAQDGRRFRAKQRKERGYADAPTVLVGEAGAEFVANNEAVGNPTVRPVLDIINMAQQQGTISTLNLPAILGAMPRVQGKATGGYTGENAVVSAGVAVPIGGGVDLLPVLERVEKLLISLEQNGVKAPIVLSDLQKQQALMAKSQGLGSR